MRKQSMLYKTLCRALSLKRPHHGEGATLFTGWLCDNTPRHLDLTIDAAGNVHIDARRGVTNRTLFVAHVDTVHRADGPNKFIKAHGTWYAKEAPLGADDGAGCAMLMHLLHSSVPGYYIFTQGEEVGGIGAKHLAKDHAELLKQFDRAIAFDRRGIDSVITHQGYGRCCSDEFAQALSDAFNVDDRLMYLPDDTGVYTDTAEFTGYIPECTNISIGYDHEHSDRECLDIYHFMALADRVVQIKWDALPTSRDPLVAEVKSGGWWEDYYTDTPDPRTTSVMSLVRGEYLDEWNEEDDVEEAIQDALAGYPGYLAELICESVHPEEPELAKRYVSHKKLRDSKVLKDHLDALHTYGAGSVLASLFDEAYAEV
jgi:hypothetical protein